MFRFAHFFVVELTLDCNAKCEYCYLKDRHEYAGQKMSFETFKNLIDHIIYNEKIINSGKKIIMVMHGGEPLLLGKKFTEKILKYAYESFKEAEIDANLSFQTNGILLDDEYLDIFEKYKCTAGISFDGDEGHNHMRTPNPEVEKDIFDKIIKYKKEKRSIGVLTVVTQSNIDYIKEFKSKVEKGKELKLIPVIDTDNVISKIEVPSKKYYDILEKDYVESLEWIDSSSEYTNTDRILKKAVTDVLFDHTESCQSTCSFKFCGSGISILSITPNGGVNVCDRWNLDHKDKFFLHKPNTYDFLGVKQIKKALKFNRILHNINIETGCDTCYARHICGGDCQSLHYSKFGRFGIDKKRVCVSTKLIYDFVSENIDKIIDRLILKGSYFSREEQLLKLKFRMLVKFQERGASINISDDRKTVLITKRENFNEGI